MNSFVQQLLQREFPGRPVVKTSLSNAGGVGLIPGQRAKTPHASQTKNQNIKQKQYCNKFNKDFKDGPHQKKSLKKSLLSADSVKGTGDTAVNRSH